MTLYRLENSTNSDKACRKIPTRLVENGGEALECFGTAIGVIHQLFGRFEGTVADDDGHRLAIRDLIGWAEEHRARW